MSRLLPFIALSAVLLLAACAGDGDTPSAGNTDAQRSVDGAQSGQDLADDVAAEVGDVTISSDRLAERTDAAMDNPQIAEQLPEDPDQVRRAVQVSALEQMIVTEAILQAAEADGISVNDQDVAAQREQLEQQAGGADALQQQVDAIGLDQDALDKELRSLAVLDAVAERDAADDGAWASPTSPDEPDPAQLAAQQWMSEQVAALDIAVDPEYGHWDPQSLHVVPPGGTQQPTAPPTS